MKIILASGSPRRIELMTAAGFTFEQYVPDVDETPLKNEDPKKMVARLAKLKAQVVFERFASSERVIVLAADTTVVTGDRRRILGKPRSEQEAQKMLRALSGKKHSVFTAYCLSSSKGSLLRVCKTDVKIRRLSAKDIDAYVKTGEPMDKAGAYAAQGVGATLIEEIRGSYTNVVGLPIAQVIFDLEKLMKS